MFMHAYTHLYFLAAFYPLTHSKTGRTSELRVKLPSVVCEK
jgi:hypothetical protein